MKKCFKCSVEKDLDDFYSHPGMSDGYLNKCKECAKRDTKDRYYSDFEKISEYEKGRNQTEDRKKKKIEYNNKRRIKFPEKYQAYIKVRNAIRSGALIKQPCEICGEEKVEAHHDDYSKPLDVRWLCMKHHREFHKKRGY